MNIISKALLLLGKIEEINDLSENIIGQTIAEEFIN